MEELKPHLSNLISVEGITAAVVIGNDGFVIESMTNGTVDTEAIAGIISGGVRNTDEMGKDLGVGKLRQSLIEFEGGMVLTRNVNYDGTVLAVVTTDHAQIGNVRYQLNKFAEQIAKNL